MAVYDDDIVKVRTLLKQGVDPNYHIHWSNVWNRKEHKEQRVTVPPLLVACENGNLEMIKILVQHGAHVHESGGLDSWLWTPLHCACAWGHSEVVKYLIEMAGCKIGMLNAVAHNIFCSRLLLLIAQPLYSHQSGHVT